MITDSCSWDGLYRAAPDITAQRHCSISQNVDTKTSPKYNASLSTFGSEDSKNRNNGIVRDDVASLMPDQYRSIQSRYPRYSCRFTTATKPLDEKSF